MSRAKIGTEGKIWSQVPDRWAGAGRECRAGKAAEMGWGSGPGWGLGPGRGGVGDVRVPT